MKDLRPDLWWVTKARKGDRAAFGRLYDRHAPRVYNLLRRLTGNADTAEDLTQETFVTAYSSLGDWRGVGAFSTWLCGIAVRRYADACRREMRQPRTSLLEDDTPLPLRRHDDPLAHCTRREAAAALDAALADLPDLCREVFLLVRVEGMRYQTVAELLGVPLGTVQSRLHRATQQLRGSLAHYLDPDDRSVDEKSDEKEDAPARKGVRHVIR